MFLERQTVSRKTPSDGKLEITESAAESLSALGATLQIQLEAQLSRAELSDMVCTCRGAERPHKHFFVVSDLLKTLRSSSEVDLDVDRESGIVLVSRVG